MMIGNFPPTWQSGKPTLRAKNDLYLCKAVVLAKTINASLAARDKTLIRVKDLKLLCASTFEAFHCSLADSFIQLRHSQQLYDAYSGSKDFAALL